MALVIEKPVLELLGADTDTPFDKDNWLNQKLAFPETLESIDQETPLSTIIVNLIVSNAAMRFKELKEILPGKTVCHAKQRLGLDA